ncbi:MAG: 2-C-methyl-D-erythritol 2,4-cyclodiphosphate synthase [Clostridia bacterium]|nr:2-C-methyl-D-erythritol 2,4-cyclodiphosphate synthase [Clostridia bacterium]
MRIGHGFDVHCLVENRKLILCGVEIPYGKGLLGHSDADVATHAVMDALLGAAGLGDIGRHFPDTDEAYRGADSLKLLRIVMDKVRDAGFSVSNVDVTIVAQMPKLAPYITQMEENLANAMTVSKACVNVKATTTEKLGFTGRGEGIAAEAVCLITKEN